MRKQKVSYLWRPALIHQVDVLVPAHAQQPETWGWGWVSALHGHGVYTKHCSQSLLQLCWLERVFAIFQLRTLRTNWASRRRGRGVNCFPEYFKSLIGYLVTRLEKSPSGVARRGTHSICVCVCACACVCVCNHNEFRVNKYSTEKDKIFKHHSKLNKKVTLSSLYSGLQSSVWATVKPSSALSLYAVRAD